jgi:hypothetical protein
VQHRARQGRSIEVLDDSLGGTPAVNAQHPVARCWVREDDVKLLALPCQRDWAIRRAVEADLADRAGAWQGCDERGQITRSVGLSGMQPESPGDTRVADRVKRYPVPG